MPNTSVRAATVVALALVTAAPLPAQPPAPAGTLVVSNMNDHTATLIDAATGRVRATLPTGEGPHEVAISRDGRWAFVTLQGRNRVVTVDLQRGAIVGSAPTGTWSDGVGFSPVVGEVGGDA